MTAQQNGTHDPATLERELAARRARLAATVDELVQRSRPQEIARRTASGFAERLKSAVTTPEGSIRIERVIAITAAALAVVAVFGVARRRR
jgi:hypothetical protein